MSFISTEAGVFKLFWQLELNWQLDLATGIELNTKKRLMIAAKMLQKIEKQKHTFFGKFHRCGLLSDCLRRKVTGPNFSLV